VHSNWSDGGDTILEMATKARDLGHEYMALTDHSPRLKVANGLSPDRLREQLDVVADVNRELAPFRLLTGIEVDILDDGGLDQEDELLAQVDVVVASVHSKLRQDEREMTGRMVKAMENPHADILGHCTGRMVMGRGRPPSTFDPEAVFGTCARHDKAVEINCRPERLDPPRELLRHVVDLGIKIAISTDAHATEQLEWQGYGTTRAVECGVQADGVVNAWSSSDLLAWCTSH
jgi:putative hydrolase